MEHKCDWTQYERRLLINDNFREVIIQLKFKVLSRRYSVKKKREGIIPGEGTENTKVSSEKE